jgi:hypothetical protein
MVEQYYAVSRVCWQSLKVSVTYKPFVLGVIMPNVVMLSAMAPNNDRKKFRE